MKYRFFFFFLIFGILSACNISEDQKQNKGQLKHLVLCWFNEPGNTRHKQKLVDAAEVLREIPGVVDVSVGGVLESDRQVVDDSFDLAYIFTFRDSASMADYLVHPDHKRIQSELLKPLVDKIVVYDFVVE